MAVQTAAAKSIKVRTAQIEAALFANRLAAMPAQLRRAIGAEHGGVGFGLRNYGSD